MWTPPVINWLINPSNYSFLRTINHSEIGILFTNLAPWGAPAWGTTPGGTALLGLDYEETLQVQNTMGMSGISPKNGGFGAQYWGNMVIWVWNKDMLWDLIEKTWDFSLKSPPFNEDINVDLESKDVDSSNAEGSTTENAGRYPQPCRFYDTSRGSRTWSRLLRCSGRSKNEAWPRGDYL